METRVRVSALNDNHYRFLILTASSMQRFSFLSAVALAGLGQPATQQLHTVSGQYMLLLEASATVL